MTHTSIYTYIHTDGIALFERLSIHTHDCLYVHIDSCTVSPIFEQEKTKTNTFGNKPSFVRCSTFGRELISWSRIWICHLASSKSFDEYDGESVHWWDSSVSPLRLQLRRHEQHRHGLSAMGWQRLPGPLNDQVSFAKKACFYRALVQTIPDNLGRLRMVGRLYED